jgi:uncharacterized membrane protein YbhN (UPF0104 family)
MFINTFGLGTVGGDVARALLLKPDEGQRLGAFSSVIADRVHGLAVLLIIGAIAVLVIQPKIFGSFENLLAIVGIICTILGWFYCPKIITWACSKISLPQVPSGIFSTFTLTSPNLLKATALSASMHLLHILMYYLLARSLSIEIPFSYLCIVVPIVNVASSLPISVNGIGVRESLLVLLLSESAIVSISTETAFLTGVLFTLIVTIVSGIGGLVCGVSGAKRIIK